MRRRLALITLIYVAIVLLTGCHRLVETESESISVYTTFWPVYALTDAVMRDVPDAKLHQLVQPQDGCLRNYQLSDWDAAMLSADADAVIMGGRGLESYENLLFGWGESGTAISAVLYNLELYNQEALTDGESETHLAGANPHLYMSLDGAAQIVESISATMQSLDPGFAGQYAENAASAVARLAQSLEQNCALLAPIEGSQVILMNEALIYVALDYGLEVADWLDRESGDALVDNELSSALERLESANARVILIEKQAPQALTEALEAAGYAVARLDVLSAHGESDGGFNAYIDIQAANARAVWDAFGRADNMEVAN